MGGHDARREPPAMVRLLRRLGERGARHTARLIRHRLTERYYERRFGIRTAGKVDLKTLGIHDPLCKIYAPTAYRSFRAVAHRIAIASGGDVFLDCGAGKGRVVCLAAMLPFRRVIGIEVSPELAEQARENIERARRWFRCPDVQVLTAHAAGYQIPDPVNVIHLFDPFKGEILLQVVANIRASLERAPRRITILYADPNHFDPLVDERPWLLRVEDVPYPFQEGERIRNMYRIYRAELPSVASLPAQELPIRIPARNTSTPPTTT